LSGSQKEAPGSAGGNLTSGAPTNASTIYNGAVPVEWSQTLQAVAQSTNSALSPVATATYTLNMPVVATPVFSLIGVSPDGTQQYVELSDTTPGAQILCTNGPLTLHTSWGSCLPTIGYGTITSGQTLYAIAEESGYADSAIASVTFPVTLPVAATPTFNVASGTYTTIQSVTISDTMPGASIYYTVDGSTPALCAGSYCNTPGNIEINTTTMLYTGPITVPDTMIINAFSVAPGYSYSAAASAIYTFNQLHFGDVAIGSSASASAIVVIPNAATLGTISVVTEGAANLDFTNAGGGTCTVGASYATMSGCTVNVSFAPIYAGARYGAVVLYDTSGNVIGNSYVQGTGQGPQIIFASSAIQPSIAVNGLPNTVPVGSYVSGNALKPILLPPLSPGGPMETATYDDITYDGNGNAYYTALIPPNVDEPASCWWSSGPVCYGESVGEQFSSANPSTSGGLRFGENLGIYDYYNFVIAVDVMGNAYFTAQAPGDGQQSYQQAFVYRAALQPDGSYTYTQIGSGWVYPSDLATDGLGNAYVYDSGAKPSPAVYKFDYADPPSLGFANTGAGSTSADSPQTVTITNYGNQPLQLSGITVPADFSLNSSAANACTGSTSLAALQSCVLSISFTPVTPLNGAQSVALNESIAVTSNTLNTASTTSTIEVTGTEILPVAATPTISLAAGTYAPGQSVTISDTTPGATVYYAINGTPVAGTNPYSGAITVNTTEAIEAVAVANGYSDSALASAAYIIESPASNPTFSVAAGTYTSVQSVTISDTTPGATIYYAINGAPVVGSNPYNGGTIAVSSTETIEAIAVGGGYSNSSVISVTYTINLPPPNFTLAASSTSLTLSSGGQGTITITVTPQNGFNSVTSFACSGLAAGASCSFNPTTVTPPGTTSTTLTITAQTLSASSLHRNFSPLISGWALALAVCLFGRRRRRDLQLILILAVAFIGLGLVSACGAGGGSGGGGGGGSVTPVTSTVTVTATSGSLQQTAEISLTVN
jgi:hypothetical protein